LRGRAGITEREGFNIEESHVCKEVKEIDQLETKAEELGGGQWEGEN
jgi:hypothetical protein